MQLRAPMCAAIVTMVVVGIGCVTLVNGWRRIGEPFPGFLIAGNRIVASVGRSPWLQDKMERILWAQVVAVDGHVVSTVEEIDTAVALQKAGTPVMYRLHKQADVFSLPIEVQRFSNADFLALHFTYFLVGLSFVVGSWWAIRADSPWPPATSPFFILCQLVALLLFLASDLFGPRWFTWVYFTVHCVVPAALWHLTITYPEHLLPTWLRRVSVLGSYAVGLGYAWWLNVVWDDPTRFLPLLYTTYLLLANALLIYFGRLAVWWRASDGPGSQPGVGLALLGGLLSLVIPGAIFVSYPMMESSISPALVVGPLAFFPVCTAIALRRLARDESSRLSQPSVRRRLSLLFLAAAETAYVAGVAVSWMTGSWEQLTAAMQLNHRRQLLVQELRDATPFDAATLRGVEAMAQDGVEADLLSGLRLALQREDHTAARSAANQLLDYYQGVEHTLQSRVAALSPVDEVFFGVLVAVGTIQAVAFMLAVRSWLMQPVAQLAAATSVIATGDLTHRVQVDPSEEFTGLGNAINAMAESLTVIQARVEVEREARHRAAATARDAERRRLGRELHDGVLQDLSAIKLNLETMQKAPGPRTTLAPAIDSLINVIVGLRQVVDDVAAPELGQDSLTQAISTYAQMAALGYGVAVTLDLDGCAPIAEWATRDVYRIAQEAITNALRHAAPSLLRVALLANNTHAVLEVEDNGSGFAYDSATFGAGLTGMRERAAAIGARLDIFATPGQGTLVRLESPLAGSLRADKPLS